MFDEAMLRQAAQLIMLCRTRRILVATAESCTGGLIAGIITAVPGSSDIFERGFVTYSNAAKIEAISVDAALIARFGAVSAEVAAAMAKGALVHSRAQIALSVTGIAGPGGGSAEKPVGLVHFGVQRQGETATTTERRFKDAGRDEIRAVAVRTALELLIQAAA